MKLTKYFWKQWDKKRAKTEKNVLLTRCKLNSKDLNFEISHGVLLLVSNEGENYEKLKDVIRVKNSERGDKAGWKNIKKDEIK